MLYDLIEILVELGYYKCYYNDQVKRNPIYGVLISLHNSYSIASQLNEIISYIMLLPAMVNAGFPSTSMNKVSNYCSHYKYHERKTDTRKALTIQGHKTETCHLHQRIEGQAYHRQSD